MVVKQRQFIMRTPTSFALEDTDRLAALRHFALLDSPAEPSFDRLTQMAARLLRAPGALISLLDVDRQFFKSCLGLAESWMTARQTPLSHSFCQHVVASGEPLVIRDARDHLLVHTNLAIRDLNVVAYLGLPLHTSTGYVLGSLCVIDHEPRVWQPDEIGLLQDLAASVMTEIELRGELIERQKTNASRAEAQALSTQLANENAELRQQIHELTVLNEILRTQAMHDGLTSLLNRRSLEELLLHEVDRAARGNYPIGVLMLDLDHFKRINDSFGHSAGDLLLRTVAKVLQAQVRGSDIACRYGGEEFVIIMPDSTQATVLARAEELRCMVKQLRVQHGVQTLDAITTSVGVAVYPDHGSQAEDLLAQADQALYRAKALGRDRVVVASR